ncbi:phage portal protein [Corynebacterium epidermidicanis]|uniref:Phage portal protein, SPP1 Gp6 n=1 Tax=Corynebacterium epidermidicanis TaxID=1050174 RepID=A0A0G3GMG7_9CORY|nr:phage portal protein [Corynebacterium epidermidicanis]AKK02334.1 Phage portal protein, SPP1 Gp6 [Corynebacterium epidermidicanis]
MRVSTESLVARLDHAQPVIARRDMYYRGRQPLRFMKSTVDPQIAGFTANLCKVAVGAVGERLNVTGILASVDGRDVSERAWKLWADADMPMLVQAALVDALAVGSAFLVVWADEFGRPSISVETAEHVVVERDPITNGVVGALKRWVVRDHNNVELATHFVKYLPKEIVHLEQSATDGKLRFVRSIPNPLGVVPVVELLNIERVGDQAGSSVVDDLAPLVDALNKLIVDMLVTSEAVARPKRWVTGVELEDPESVFLPDAGFEADAPVEVVDVDAVADEVSAESPFKDSDDLWVAEQADAKFGQLQGADLAGYETGVNLIVQQIMAISGLPGHLVGVTTSNPATAEALRASEVALTSRAQSRIRVFDKPLEWAVRLMVAIDAGVSPDRVEASVQWADPSTRSIAQEADAAVKLVQQEVISTDEARARVGEEKIGA